MDVRRRVQRSKQALWSIGPRRVGWNDLRGEPRGQLCGRCADEALGELALRDEAPRARDRRGRRVGGIGAKADRLEAGERDALLRTELRQILRGEPCLEEKPRDDAVGARSRVRSEEPRRERAVRALAAKHRDALVSRGDAAGGVCDGAADERSERPAELDLEREARRHLVAEFGAHRGDGAVGKRARDRASDGAAQEELWAGRGRGRSRAPGVELVVARAHETAIEPQQDAHGGRRLERNARSCVALGGERVGVEPCARREVRGERGRLGRLRLHRGRAAGCSARRFAVRGERGVQEGREDREKNHEAS